MFWLDYADERDELPFLIDGVKKETLSYIQVFQQADRLFRHLSRGVVAILCQGNLETITGYVGGLRHKHVPLLLNNELSNKNLNRALNTYEVEYVFAPSFRTISQYKSEFEFENYKLWRRTAPLNNAEIHEDLAVLIPTSGSTGDPKCVRLSQRNLQSCTESILNYLSLNSDRRAISLLPLHYSYGLSVLNIMMGVRGSYLLSGHSPISRQFWNDIVEWRVTDLAAVPFVYESLKRMRFSDDVLTTLKCVTQAGGRLAPALSLHFHKIFTEHKISYFTMYGQTEASPRIAYLKPSDAVQKNGSVGKVIDIGAVDLDTSKGLKDEGELIYSGPNVCLGYAEARPDLAKGDEFRGVLKTGDIAKIDKDGFIFITGRLKRSVKVNDVTVSLDFIEATLQQQSFFSYVVGADNKIVIVVCKADKEEISRFVKREFDFPSSIWRIEHLDALPTTGVGKPDYMVLERLFIQDVR